MPFVGDTRLATGPGFVPPMIRTPADSGLTLGLMTDMVVKTVYQAGAINTQALADALHVRFSVISPLVRELIEQAVFTTRTVQLDGKPTSEYAITQKGEDRARRALERSDYGGPLPVPLDVYV